MARDQKHRDVAAGRLSAEDYRANFSEVRPPLDPHQAIVEADRCYFCHDAPCTIACPTSIDIPMFIRQISTGNPKGSAETIFKANILGGICARVCPTEQLCEEVCVRNVAEEKPVKIGLLQRYATDILIEADQQVFQRAPASGKRIAVVGAGPAGLACAHKLAVLGHEVTIFEARPKPGGLNEYGIAAYKTLNDFAQREVGYILGIGGITMETGKELGQDFTLHQLREDFDAVFLGLGLGAVNALRMADEHAEGVDDAVSEISELRQAEDLSQLAVGREVVVIGGGMTAIDIAVQTKHLGAEHVTIVYRRSKSDMRASRHEQELAQISGVKIIHNAWPAEILTDAEELSAVRFEYTRTNESGKLDGTGEHFTLPADVLFKAIGQKSAIDPDVFDLDCDKGQIVIDQEGRTSLAGVWAGGDCICDTQGLTVAAVENGKIAAQSIDRDLSGAG